MTPVLFALKKMMEENRALNGLVLFGLTRQEANIYLCLYQNGELTGYEVAKQTGISRSNVYSALAGLTDKGAAYLAQGTSSKYVAVPIEEFCDNKIRGLNQEKEYLINNIPAMKEQEIGYITIEGYKNIWDKVVNMVRDADKRIYISACYHTIEQLKPELQNVVKRGIKLVILSDQRPQEAELIGEITYYQCENRGNNIRLIIDSAFALTGEITGSREDTCLYTGQKNFINVFKDTLRNEIRLTQLQGGEKNE
ncbi:MAG: helix-turn-helix domain-containing protein [Lachnospiraceae bacterium]|nr:helix-turn-helix domain-containing protein [Lachnospiraceae bacterium]